MVKNSYLNSLKLSYPVEIIFNDIVDDLEVKEHNEVHPNKIFYLKGDKYFAEYNEISGRFYCDCTRF